VKLGGLRRRTVDRNASPGNLRFRNMLPVTLIFEPMTLKLPACHAHLALSNCDKFH